MEVRSDWPDVFRPLGDKVKVAPFSREACTVVAHYVTRKGALTNQFQDCCINAGIKGPVDFRLDWTITDRTKTDALLKHGKPIVCVQLPRRPMDRKDSFGIELLPDGRVTQQAINQIRGHALIVQIGSGKPLYPFEGIDVDLAGRTTVAEMIDVASVASGFVGYCSFMVPLAESLKKPALFMWARAGLNSPHAYIRAITPQKILSRGSSVYAFDDWPKDRISGAVEGLLQSLGH